MSDDKPLAEHSDGDQAKDEAVEPITCPTSTAQPNGSTHTIVGCGSTNVSGPDDEGLYDCLDCGIWFDPALEEES